MRANAIAIISIIFLLSAKTYASQISGFEALRAENPTAAMYYILGIGAAFTTANAELEVNHQKKLFCQPEGLALNGDNFMDLYQKQLKKNEKWLVENNAPIASVLLGGLREAFPCKK